MQQAGASRWLAVFLLALAWLCLPAQAFDEQRVLQAENNAKILSLQLKDIQSSIANQTLSDEQLTGQRDALDKLRAAIQADSTAIDGPLGEVTTQVTQLGPVPENGQPEAPAIAQQRKALNDQLARLTAVKKQFTLLTVETEQTESRVTQIQRTNFLQRIFQSGRSILDPRLWVETTSASGVLWQRVATRVGNGFNTSGNQVAYPPLLMFPIGLLAMWLVLFVAVPRVFKRLGIGSTRSDAEETETSVQRLWHVVWGVVKLIFVVFFVSLLVTATLAASNLITTDMATLIDHVLTTAQVALINSGLVYLVASPGQPQRRLIAIDNQSARTLPVITLVASLIYGIGDSISSLATSYNLPVSFAVGQSAFTALAMILLIGLALVILRRQAAANIASADGKLYFLTWFLKFLPVLWLLLGIAALSLVFGFIALSYFIAGNLLDTAILTVLFGILHAFADALATAMLDPQSGPGRAIRRVLGWSEQTIGRAVLVFRTVADALLVLLGLASLIGLWTVVLFDFPGLWSMLGNGITIGNITVSPWAVAVALLVLSVGVFITRVITNWLDTRVLAATQLDKGVQNSLRSVAGYTGYMLAAILAFSAAGVDFSSLALVAGALGVGVGLGLQSVVTNFVSGLILLVERPVRVGDWVVTKSGEGIVKKINVRSTEIETFDNCTVIVPNSMLVNDSVRNWTHRDTIGRFNVTVALAHGVNVDTVVETLTKLLREHPKVMRHPPPSVQLGEITPATLNFDLHGHTLDVFDAGKIGSDLRIAIVKAFPHTQLHVQPAAAPVPVATA